MKKKLFFLAVAAVSMAGCKNFKQGDGGLLYNIVEHKNGTAIKEGDLVSLNGIIKTDADSVLSNTYDMGHPSALVMPKPQFKGDLISAISMLSEGDSAVIKINADTMTKKSGQPRPPGFKGKYFIYSLRIVKVIPKDNQPDSVFQKKVAAYFKTISEKARADEPVKIKNYIESKKLNVTKTPSGLNYLITTPGSGPKAAVNDTVVVNYVGKFVDGKVFDTSIEQIAKDNKKFQVGHQYKPARIPVGIHAVIPGWDEGLLLLSKGSKATFVIPSTLAYGEQGAGQVIPPFAPIIFDVEIVDIVHPNPNAPKPVMPMMPQAQQQQPQVKK